MSNPYYRDYSDFLSEHFGGKVQKLTVNAGFSCPNRDGKKGFGGCSYCNNSTFSPSIGEQAYSVSEQLSKAKAFFGRKYKDMKYLAYFQTYTNTNADIETLRKLYSEALSDIDVVGMVIATRPDCINHELLTMLAELNDYKPVLMEYGAESSHNATLTRVNRCHTWEETVSAVELTKVFGLSVGLHFIMGLPGETREMMLQTVDRLNELNVDTVKFHQLQIVKGTRLAKEYEGGYSDIYPFDLDDYLELCVEIVDRIKQSIAIDRFTASSPENLLIAPRWGIKNYQFTHLLHNRLKERMRSSRAEEV